MNSTHSQTRPRIDKRDTGLDLVRCTALVFMLFAHCPIISETAFVSSIKFIVGSAPALFYFAFGMTFSRFARKSTLIKIRITFAFFVVAVFLNLAFTGKYIYYEFFFFLWLSQCAMAAIFAFVKKPAGFDLAAISGVLILMVVLPYGYISDLFKTAAKGNFPFLPWFIFVLAGNLFNCRPRSSFSIAALLISISAVLHFFGPSKISIQKYPLSVTYFTLFSGAAVLIYGLGNKIHALSKNRITLFISRNLLLAAILHQMTYIVIRIANYPIKRLSGGDVIAKHPNYSMILMPVLCVVILTALIKTATGLWAAAKKNGFIRKRIMTNSIATAVSFTALYYLISSSGSSYMLLFARIVLIAGMAVFGMLIREAKALKYLDIDIVFKRSRELFIGRIRGGDEH